MFYSSMLCSTSGRWRTLPGDAGRGYGQWVFRIPQEKIQEKIQNRLSGGPGPFLPAHEGSSMTDERRKSRRYQTPEFKSNLSDGNSAFIVVIEDVSLTGVGVSQVPEGFDETVNKCFAVINALQKDFTLVLQPRWVSTNGKGPYKRIGFQIENPPPAWLDFVEALKEEIRKKNLRESRRHRILGLMAVLSNGKSKYLGVVEDLSEKGLCLTQVPADFDESAGSCTAVVNSPTGDVPVSLHPCWIRSTNRGMYKTIGFKIQNPPPGWQGLVEELGQSDGQLGFLVMEEDDEGSPEDKS
jgi:hypothetical protein